MRGAGTACSASPSRFHGFRNRRNEATSESVPGAVGLVLLDGWKDMNLPLLKMLEPRLAAGALLAREKARLSHARGAGLAVACIRL